MGKRRRRLLLVEWEDACNHNHDWIGVDTIPKKLDAHVVTTVGFEVRRDAERVVLAMSRSNNRGNPENCCDLFTIPVPMIRRERVLRK